MFIAPIFLQQQRALWLVFQFILFTHIFTYIHTIVHVLVSISYIIACNTHMHWFISLLLVFCTCSLFLRSCDLLQY